MKYRKASLAATVVVTMTLAACAESGTGSGDNGTSASTGELSGLVDGWEPITLPDDYDDVSFNWAGITPTNDWRTAAEEALVDFVRAESDGKIDITLHPAGTLVAPDELTEALSDGTIGVSEVYPAYAPSGYPMDTWIGSMAWLPDNRPILGDLQAMAASMEWSYNEPLVDEFESRGILPVVPKFAAHSNYHLLCTQEVRSLADAKGVQTRIAGPAWIPSTEAVGLEGVQLSATELFEGMQRGVYECFMGSLRDFHSYGLLELADYITMDSEASFTPFYTDAIAANPQVWEDLGPEGREILKRGFAVYFYVMLEEALSRDVIAIESAREQGIEIGPMDDDFRDALEAQQADSLDNAVANAPASITAEAQELKDSYVASFEKWETKLENMGYGKYGATWDEFMQEGNVASDIDLQPFIQILWDEVIDPNIETGM